ncbi:MULTISPECIES: molybdenum ABC transporter ATP-binding protein ModC [Lonsdalea]|uniref:Molybdenum ABC transporter ATP-binding protein n=2 Tax=Lonsdalea TaxID=1082702 RepID=A0ACD1J9B1_9GAMM|nr:MULTISPECIES: molybdenum ABC transporter ATP-binding protein ModC [Lonsdalea]OSN02021.1 molybdenum ABC transporter ATP-binding protein [Lonsdalea populi]QPQ25273.1 molybdenum ABC transporter ATP-binding protein ModC [Lonsdalea populi]RAT10691.1 molybdenum ABC transporter ATP-binding protein [Lonsdalea quercina]RAT17266.1 molybdenum ABC transporter ATP-binding protein [Lonsdalea populi]RAT19103.1 molybdenum ABC transporter ATP-binding protein [Lonsdalea populi]
MLQLDFSQQLGDLSLSVTSALPASGISAIFGVSGAGKTSLINAIAGLTRPDRGRIQLNDRVLTDIERRISLPPEQRHIGYVFQDARLFPHYRVAGNLRYGMVPAMRGQFDDIVQLLGIEHLLKRYPLTLSGGEKQRVSIGRALLTAPDLLLMDEPLASLDAPRKRELLPYLERLGREVKTPILYVSHSLEEIWRLADRVLVLDQGEVKTQGELETVWASSALRPWLPREEQSTILKTNVLQQHPRYPMTALMLGDQHLWVQKIDAPLYSAQRIRINAADVSLTLEQPTGTSIRNVLAARVTECLEVGDQVEVKLRVGGQALWAKITPWARDELGLCPDQRLFAQIKSVSITP